MKIAASFCFIWIIIYGVYNPNVGCAIDKDTPHDGHGLIDPYLDILKLLNRTAGTELNTEVVGLIINDFVNKFDCDTATTNEECSGLFVSLSFANLSV